MKKYRKLVRDRIPQIIEKTGEKATVHILSHSAYLKELKRKLIEEASEAEKAKGRKELTKELADLLEVIEATARAHKIPPQELSRVKRLRRKERGGFRKRLLLESVN